MDLLERMEKIKEQKEKTLLQLKPPKIIVEEEEFEKESMISFKEISNSSEFKRLVYLIQFGKTHRGKSEDLERKLLKRRQEITVIKEYERGTHKDFKEVVMELKNKLLKQKEVVENGTDQ